ncbi:serine hydrolase [Caulobacter segnis]|uniref:serine hydrolase domain-containing protein n=1 Tax=Caulobacter segnis TaxID=88688 RepID=UPI00240F593E|nr:serine hydrolase domain-containing protein [Caulobacter segnis]MDG2520560.1 serine hydrolase [Caulobacter segnis]
MLRSSLIAALMVGAWALTPAAHANPSVPACTSLGAAVDAFGQKTLSKGAPGLVVAVDAPGRTPVITAFGLADLEARAPMQPQSVFKIASLTKQFTAAAVLALAETGRVDLDRPVADYLPDQSFAGQITVRQLLIQTAGLADYAETLARDGTKSVRRTPDQMAAVIAELKPLQTFRPGEAWTYSNSNYVLLGLLIEKVTGASYGDFLHTRILERAGMTASAVDRMEDIVPMRVRGYSRAGRSPLQLRNADWIDPSVPGAAGSMRATASDLLAWSRALFEGRIVSRQSLELMTSPGRLSDGRTTREGMPQAWREGLQADYAMGLFRSASPLGARLWHTGDIDGFSVWMARYPEKDMTLVVLMNADFLDLDTASLEAAVAAEGCAPG